MATLNYKILPNRRKASGKLGVYLSLTHRKEVRYISTEFEIDDESEFEDGLVCYRKDAAVMNKRMAYVLRTYQEKLEGLNIGMYDTCARLKNELVKVEPEEVSMTLRELFLWRIKELERSGKRCYAKMNEDSMKVILKIIGDPFIEHLTRADVKLLSKKMMSKGYSPGGIQIKMAHLKAALNAAVDERWVKYDDHPFTGYRMPSAAPREMDVTVEQFQAVRDFETNSKRMAWARDMFLLSGRHQPGGPGGGGFEQGCAGVFACENGGQEGGRASDGVWHTGGGSGADCEVCAERPYQVADDEGVPAAAQLYVPVLRAVEGGTWHRGYVFFLFGAQDVCAVCVYVGCKDGGNRVLHRADGEEEPSYI